MLYCSVGIYSNKASQSINVYHQQISECQHWPKNYLLKNLHRIVVNEKIMAKCHPVTDLEKDSKTIGEVVKVLTDRISETSVWIRR